MQLTTCSVRVPQTTDCLVAHRYIYDKRSSCVDLGCCKRPSGCSSLIFCFLFSDLSDVTHANLQISVDISAVVVIMRKVE